MIEPKGIYIGTGEVGAGKTMWALGAYPIDKTAYFFDDKEFSIDGLSEDDLEKKFGLFVNLRKKYPLEKYKTLGFYEVIKKEMDNIPDNKFDAIIFDTWTRAGKAVRAYAEKNPYEFREKSTFSNRLIIAGKEKKGDAARVEVDFTYQLSNKCKALFLIAHTKETYKNDTPTGIFIADLHYRHKQSCNSMFWFLRNRAGVPTVLVMKPMAKIELVNGMISPVNLLPEKITPLPEDKSVWDCIERYSNEPFGNREPRPDEKPSEFETGILKSEFTDNQKEMWAIEVRTKQEREQEERKEKNLFLKAQLQNIKKEAKALIASGLASPLAFAQLKEKHSELTQEQFSEMIK